MSASVGVGGGEWETPARWWEVYNGGCVWCIDDGCEQACRIGLRVDGKTRDSPYPGRTHSASPSSLPHLRILPTPLRLALTRPLRVTVTGGAIYQVWSPS